MAENPRRAIMCPPEYFTVEYEINPWMDNDVKVDKKKASKQWNTLKSTYKKMGIEVHEIPPKDGFPDLCFTTDHGILIGNTLIAARFRYKERQSEQEHALSWYKDNGYKIVDLPKGVYLEGGDVLTTNGKLIIGHGFRTSKSVGKEIEKVSGKKAIEVRIVDELFFHLDTCFLPLGDETAFYYPPAFSGRSVKRLGKNIPNLIELSKNEVENFAANSLCLGKTVIHQKGLKSFVKKVKSMGYETVEIDVSEFNKSGGGIHCLTQMKQ